MAVFRQNPDSRLGITLVNHGRESPGRITDSWQTNLYLVAGRSGRAMYPHLPNPAYAVRTASAVRARVRVCSMGEAASYVPLPVMGLHGAYMWAAA